MIKNSRNIRGSTIIIVIAIVFIVSFSIAAILSYVRDIHRLTERSVAREKSIMTAEAGNYQLLHYFSYPGDLDAIGQSGNGSKIRNFFIYYDTFKATHPDPWTAARNAAFGTTDPLMQVIDQNTTSTKIEMNDGKVINLKITLPAHPDALFTFESKAIASTTQGGLTERTAYMDVGLPHELPLISPAGIIAANMMGVNGHFNLAWGEGWGLGDISMKINRGNWTGAPPWGWEAKSDNNQGVDEWTKYRSTGYLRNDNNTTNLVNSNTINDISLWEKPGGKDYSEKLFQWEDLHHSDDPLSDKINDTLDKFRTLGNPDIGYEFWKDIAIRRDTYFRVAANGNVYDAQGRQLYISSGVLNTNGVGSPLTATSAMEYYRSLSDVFVAFFDTKDGNPPALDGSNWADIKFTGSISTCSRGLLYVAGSLDVGGSGTPPSFHVRDPNEVAAGIDTEDSSHTLNLFHDGVIFTYGNFSYQGNGRIYGSIITNGSYEAGGDPAIYYNAALASGEPQPISSRLPVLRVTIPSGLN